MDRNEFDLIFEQQIKEAKMLIPDELLPDLPPSQLTPDVPNWHDFEHLIWQKGEKIRQLIYNEKRKLSQKQVDEILSICTSTNAKRGRESFLMLLGKKCYAEYAPQLVGLLQDKYIEGHIVSTLYKMGVPNYATEITPFISHKQTWISNVAKQYIQRYGN